MGGVPKQRHTKSRRNRGRSHLALAKAGLIKCPKCKADILPHRVCFNCGTYKGKAVIDVLAKLDKKEKKAKEKEIAEK
ncbi:50S ribosomal protein L32 [Candidatus Azambacteria bacterium RIFCSPHIGHO2_01_46_10]|uniref:Large ribosomal subunit protein bL32 n=3 Tax=Candidatus Azamiibacteriota TaxID=1752741 RepID=A0A1F5C8N3_9BACT|nr:MAG: 50S ribosomal protein L32 [Candidatus Azambacteria bacterium RIFCSPHIGHO2_01_46_10]OGD39219.1 MAG: 50S ribosomal protein L32 [Candidatus Azambacteria bacterium RIFCSPLOWO2_01_FULL_46_26]OGD44331.1 MAG: 50S ribosomal protein L32 [Candidatus Azambacteria bacterium RIFCSPLOWO2_02_FULL_46_11]HAM96166.1 50S ribosomal protein L32 [Candidatus Azambacteria bacterium]HAQ05751.1 50S ribosomal protein L32 [Candidatus Azambacteria bacterium]